MICPIKIVCRTCQGDGLTSALRPCFACKGAGVYNAWQVRRPPVWSSCLLWLVLLLVLLALSASSAFAQEPTPTLTPEPTATPVPPTPTPEPTTTPIPAQVIVAGYTDGSRGPDYLLVIVCLFGFTFLIVADVVKLIMGRKS